MNNIESVYNTSKSIADFSIGYTKYLVDLLNRLDHDSISKFVSLLIKKREEGKKVFFIGNGGSAATASHFANDIGFGTRCYDKPFKVISLTDNCAVMTALGNDDGYEDIFYNQLRVLMEEGDALVAISASGNSPNLLKAINYANEQGNETFGLVGFDGGKMLEICKSSIHIKTPKGEYGPVEDLHMIMDHLVGNYLNNFVRQQN